MHLLHAIPQRFNKHNRLFITIAAIALLFANYLTPSLNAASPLPIKPPHYRGLIATPDHTLWISGTQGTILRGKFVDSFTVRYDTCKTQYPTKDFRDIWAIDQHTAVAMSISDSAVIIKTTDGGNSWKTVYHDETPGIFLDVIEIDPKTGVGIVLGDPLSQNQQSQKHFKALLTTDFGNSWINIPDAEWSIPLDTLESFFAASGTSLSIILSKANHRKQQYALTVGFAGGGLNPQFHLLQIGYTPKKSAAQEPQTDQPSAWKFKSLPTLPMTLKGGPAWGCYGLSIHQYQHGIAVGGNYASPDFRGDSSGAIAAYSNDILNQWQAAKTPPNGYRSGVCISQAYSKEYIFNLFFRDIQNHCNTFYTAVGELPSDYFFKTHHAKFLTMAFCTGTNGTDISFDGGKNWLALSQERGFNACTWHNNTLILVGNQGKIKTIPVSDMANLFQQLNPLDPTR